MAKAKRMLEDNLKLIDVVLELVDARAPAATRNPDFDSLFKRKRRIILLNKSDLADPQASRAWIAHYRQQGIAAGEIAASSGAGKKQAVALLERTMAHEVARYREKGMNKTVRALVVGIPNVGKSTFINSMAGGARTQTGDRPGVTKGKQWVRVTPYLELMDSPGLLWPKLEDPELALHLAFLGSINDEIMDIEQLAAELLTRLQTLAPSALTARYSKVTGQTPPEELLPKVCQSRGFLLPKGQPDTERAARIVLDEFRGGKLGRITLEGVDKD